MDALITKNVVKKIAVFIIIVMIGLPILNALFVSGLGIYNISLDSSGTKKYSAYPVYGGVYMNKDTLVKLYNWYTKVGDNSDIPDFISFLFSAGLPVTQKTIKDFLLLKRVCNTQQECDDYYENILRNNEDKQKTNYIAKNEQTISSVAKKVVLPNSFVGSPIEGWNSFFVNDSLKPAFDNGWYGFFSYKLLVDNYYKYSNSDIKNINSISLVSFYLPNPDKHCYGNFKINVKPQNCDNNSNKNCLPKEYSFNINTPKEILDNLRRLTTDIRRKFKTLSNSEIDIVCNQEEKKVSDLKTAISQLYDYLVWLDLSSPVFYTNYPKEFEELTNNIFLTYKQDISIKLPDPYLTVASNSIKTALGKYFNTNYLKDNNWHTDQILTQLYTITKNPSSVNNLPETKKVLLGLINKSLVPLSLEIDRQLSIASSGAVTLEKKFDIMKRYIKKKIELLHNDIDKIKNKYVNFNSNTMFDPDKLYTILVISTKAVNADKLNENLGGINSIINAISKLLTSVGLPRYTQGILIEPIYYKGTYIISKPEIQKIILDQTLTTAIYPGGTYPVYYLMKTKPYDTWESLSNIKQGTFVFLYTYILNLLFLSSYILYIIALVLALVMSGGLLYSSLLRADLSEKYSDTELEEKQQEFYSSWNTFKKDFKGIKEIFGKKENNGE